MQALAAVAAPRRALLELRAGRLFLEPPAAAPAAESLRQMRQALAATAGSSISTARTSLRLAGRLQPTATTERHLFRLVPLANQAMAAQAGDQTLLRLERVEQVGYVAGVAAAVERPRMALRLALAALAAAGARLLRSISE